MRLLHELHLVLLLVALANSAAAATDSSSALANSDSVRPLKDKFGSMVEDRETTEVEAAGWLPKLPSEYASTVGERSLLGTHDAKLAEAAMSWDIDLASHEFLTYRNSGKCASTHPHSEVFHVNDGRHSRCFSMVSPFPHVDEEERSIPLLFYFHASTSDAAHCGSGRHRELGDLAVASGFALICAEGLQDYRGRGGRWIFPEVVTDATGNRCHDTDSMDLVYVKNILKLLSRNRRYDTKRVFMSGCSMGSQFALYATMCFKDQNPRAISAFATHSSGLKVKGDGLKFPLDIYNTKYEWGECPECQYTPVVPKKYTDPLGLKACVFDNLGDTSGFYGSSLALARHWKALNMTVEMHMTGMGGHCHVNSWRSIVGCLDAGSGRLLRNGLRSTRNQAVDRRKRAIREREPLPSPPGSVWRPLGRNRLSMELLPEELPPEETNSTPDRRSIQVARLIRKAKTRSMELLTRSGEEPVDAPDAGE